MELAYVPHFNTWDTLASQHLLWGQSKKLHGLIPVFLDELLLTDPVPSTNFHNDHNNTQSIVWLGEQSHTH